ncbi:MAG: NADH-quinone oxidoreductase subunit A [Chloroflexi bacterium]|nr:NADH-quinone oxidoreductase subunit A [Chloroflexota bacterium]
MPDYFLGFAYVGVFVAAGALLVVATIALSHFLAPQRPMGDKLIPYESGEEPVGQAWVQFPIHYFIFALLFVVFDVEAIFLFAWAVMFRSLGIFGFVEMIIFLGILVVGLIYAWRKRMLEWV